MNVLLLGFGLAGEFFHAPLLAATPQLRVRGVVTSRPERAEAARKRFPEATTFGRADQAWARAGDFDLAIVATPDDTHVSLARAALEHGLHVVVDKPLAPTAAEGQALVEFAETCGRQLTPFQNRRWDGDFRTVQQLVVGKVHRFDSRLERWRPEGMRAGWKAESPGGVLFDLGAHLVDQALHLFGPPSSVYAEVRALGENSGANNDAFVALTQAGGVISHLWMSLLAAESGPRFRLLGDQGAYTKFGVDVQEEQSKQGLDARAPEWGVEPESAWGRMAGKEPVPTLPGCYQEFYRQLAEGGSPVRGADAVLTLRVLEAALRSSRSGQVVEL